MLIALAVAVASAWGRPAGIAGIAGIEGIKGRVGRQHLIAAVLIFLIFLIAYFPPFLARYGPYGEDKYFLSVLLRLAGGQRAYLDFEFIYGPLLLQPLAGWMGMFGYSLTSYYWLLALVEAATFAALLLLLARLIPDRRRWLLVSGIAVLLLLNDNLGFSWIALRRLLPVVTLVAWSLRGPAPRSWVASAALIAAQVVLSLEYAIASALAIGAAALAETVLSRRPQPFVAGVLAAATGAAGGLVLGVLLLGGGVLGWLVATFEVMVLRGAGEAGFPFQVSVNAVAVLGLLLLAAARAGAGIREARERGLAAGDRLLLAAIFYAFVALKSGLARSDMYHLVPPVLGLVAATLLPLPSLAFAAGPGFRRAAAWAVALICLTYAPGLAGYGRLWAQGLVLGGLDVVRGVPANGVRPQWQRGPLIGPERTESNPTWTSLAEYLADTTRAAVPVLYYESAWGLDRHIGVAKPAGVYATDDYLVSDAAGDALRGWLEGHPEALLLADTGSWAWIHDAAREPADFNMFWIGRRRSGAMRFLERWSSSHYGTAVMDENQRKRARWARTVGAWVRERYAPLETFGRYHVLARRNAT